MKKGNKKAMLSMEIVTALAILTIAIIPMLSLHTISIKYSRQLYYKSVITEMLNDRITILRTGGWEKFGLCEEKKINFVGEAGKNLPEGDLLLSIKGFKDYQNLLKVTLCWRPKRVGGFREINKETIIFVQ